LSAVSPGAVSGRSNSGRLRDMDRQPQHRRISSASEPLSLWLPGQRSPRHWARCSGGAEALCRSESGSMRTQGPWSGCCSHIRGRWNAN